MKKGLTLIEVIIVFVIIAIIAAIAIPRLWNARIARNEAAAIAACQIYAEAQETHHHNHWEDDDLLEYEMSLHGLFSSHGLDFSIDAAFVHAEGNPGTAIPRAGYVFKVLTRQGIFATGGARSYVTTNHTHDGGTTTNMTLGYALSATPSVYGSTGRNTFIINHAGVIYQKDKGCAKTRGNPGSLLACARSNPGL